MTYTPPFTANISHVTYGERGKASIVSRPDRLLDANTRYLLARMEAAELGQALFLYNAIVESTTLVGMPVYFNSTNNRFEKALAAVEQDPTTGTMVAKESADVVGVVYSKNMSSTLADLLVLGIATLDISNALTGSATAGRYYLSAGTAGRLQRQRPPVTVFVLRAFGDGRVFVAPDMKDFLEDHIHVCIDLQAVPAGSYTPPATGDIHTITAPDSSIVGWLPASHASFSGNAPSGACFGYNIAAHTALQQVWPPIPINAVLLEMYRPVSSGVDRYIGGRVPADLLHINTDGIWWMSNCYDQVPWPTDYSASSESSSSSETACPVAPSMELKLTFTRMTYAIS